MYQNLIIVVEKCDLSLNLYNNNIFVELIL